MDIKAKFSKLILLPAAVCAAMAVTSCEMVFEGEGDCSLHCQLKFRYDMNMKFGCVPELRVSCGGACI